ncbi:hypothetical protein P4O66_002668 [Electrophorus voltai]|uniref:Reverse transcriptase domain-containing protein n=1 Tax=Electrophorus voltai TaxID=2609070 RepID=A0AAD8YWJ3_9TELE|nr:hypothetical protein P4O66_002668 [Electrophorus voltai]
MRCRGQEQRSGAEVRSRGQEQRSGAEMRCRGQEQRSGAEVRSRGEDRRSGAEVRSRGQEQRSGAEVRSMEAPTLFHQCVCVYVCVLCECGSDSSEQWTGRRWEPVTRGVARHAESPVTRSYPSLGVTCHVKLPVTRSHLSLGVTCHSETPVTRSRPSLGDARHAESPVTRSRSSLGDARHVESPTPYHLPQPHSAPDLLFLPEQSLEVTPADSMAADRHRVLAQCGQTERVPGAQRLRSKQLQRKKKLSNKQEKLARGSRHRHNLEMELQRRSPLITEVAEAQMACMLTTLFSDDLQTDHKQYGWATAPHPPSHLSTGAPQGCVLSPLLYSLYTYDRTATSSSTIIVKFADTVVMGLISDNDERAYLEEIKHLENWCQENNLLLNISKTKDLIVDCSKKQERHYQPVSISGTTVERVDSFRYLGVHISQDLSWSRHTNSLAKKARQRLYHLRRLRDFRLPSKVLRNFYTCTIESILTGNITVWLGNSTKQDRQALQRVVRSAERITYTELPDLQTIYYKRCQTKTRRIVKDPTHPNNRLFSLLREPSAVLKAVSKQEQDSTSPPYSPSMSWIDHSRQDVSARLCFQPSAWNMLLFPGRSDQREMPVEGWGRQAHSSKTCMDAPIQWTTVPAREALTEPWHVLPGH